MEQYYNFNDAQALLGSLNQNIQDDYQLTSDNLYLNNDLWSAENASQQQPQQPQQQQQQIPQQQFQVKQEYISPSSMNHSTYGPGSSENNQDDEHLMDEIINFDDQKYSNGNGQQQSLQQQQQQQQYDDSTGDEAFVKHELDTLDELIHSASTSQAPTPPRSTTSSAKAESPIMPSLQGNSIKMMKDSPGSVSSHSSGITPNKVSKPPKKSRSSHNAIEKKYRTNINVKILELRDAVPALRIAADNNQSTTIDDLEGLTPAAKLNKASILTKATEYIQHLENKNEILANEVFQLRDILTRFQQALPQLSQNVAFQQQAQPSQQAPSQQAPEQSQQQFQGHSSSPHSQITPNHQQHQTSPLNSSNSKPGSDQAVPTLNQQPRTAPRLTQQSFTDQVNMGLNGFVPTYQQIEAAQLQLQNYAQQPPQQQQQQYAQQHQQQQHQQQQHIPHNDASSMSFGNKMLVGGMTTLLGTQMFSDGGADGGYDFKGLSMIPLHKLFPAMSSESSQSLFSFMRVILVLFGAVTVFEPLLVAVLHTFLSSNDQKPKKQATTDKYSAVSVLHVYVQVALIKLGLKLPKSDIAQIAKFNEDFNLKITKFLNKSASETFVCVHGWKEALLFFSEIESFRIPEPQQHTKDTTAISALIEFSFAKLILAKFISIKLGSMAANFLGLNKTVDVTMLKIIKFSKNMKSDDENISKIIDLVTSDIEFIDSRESLYDGLCMCFGLSRENALKSLIKSQQQQQSPVTSLTGSNLRNVTDLVRSSDSISLVNLVATLRCQEIFDNNLIKYTELMMKSNKTQDEEQDEETSDNVNDDNASVDTQETDFDHEASMVKEIYAELNKFEKFVPRGSVQLTKSYKFFKLLIKPDASDLSSIVEMIKSEACDLIDYSSAIGSELNQESSQIQKIVHFAKTNSSISRQHILGSSQLISEENHLLLTCSFITYYHSVGKFEEYLQLIRFLNVNTSLSLLSLVSLVQVSQLLIKELMNKEDQLNKTLASVESKEIAEEDDDDDDDDDSSTLNLSTTKILESKLRSLDTYKNNVEQLILRSRLLLSRPCSNFNSLNLDLKSDLSDQLVTMGKKINGYD